MTLSTQTGTYGGYTLLEIIERVCWNLGQVSSGSVSYSRFPKARILDAVNEVSRALAIHYPSVLKVCIVNTVADKGWYLCPPGMIPNGIRTARFYTDATSYEVLEIWDRKKLERDRDGWITASSGTPEIIVMGPLYGDRFTFEVYPSPSTAGTWTAPVRMCIGDAPSTTSVSVSGVAKLGSTASGLVNASATFTERGLAAGMAVWNTTKNVYGWIESVGATRISLSASLITPRDGATASGSFAATDSYEIITDFIGTLTDWDEDADQYIYSTGTGYVTDLAAAANNIVLEYWSYPIPLAQDSDYPQMPKTLQDALIDLTTARVARMGHEKTRQLGLADRYEQSAAMILETIGDSRSIPFNNKPYRLKVKLK